MRNNCVRPSIIGESDSPSPTPQCMAMARKNPQPLEESFCVRFRSPPPVSIAKTPSLHSDQPRPAPSLAGFFTSACGLGTHPRGAVFGRFLPISLSLSLPLADVQSPKSARRSSKKFSDLGNPPDPGILSNIGRHLQTGEKKSPLKLAQPHAFCCHQGRVQAQQPQPFQPGSTDQL